MEQRKETDDNLLLSRKIPDRLVDRIRREAEKIEFGKIVLNISPKNIKVEYTRFEQEPESR